MVEENGFRISKARQGDVEIVSISGRIDAHNTPKLSSVLEDMIRNNKIKIVIDMSRVAFISSFGLGVIYSSLRQVKGKNGDIKLYSLPAEVMLPFKVTGLLPRFSVFEKLSDAVSAFAHK